MSGTKKKLTDQDIEEIYIELREGLTYREIGQSFGVSGSLIQQIRNGDRHRIPGFNYPVLKPPPIAR